MKLVIRAGETDNSIKLIEYEPTEKEREQLAYRLYNNFDVELLIPGKIGGYNEQPDERKD
jgi:hypothetical protein